MSTQLSILVTGATGYIGGSVLARLLGHPEAHSFSITTLVRSQSSAKAKILKEKFNVKAVIGSLDDGGLVSSLTEEADVVISCAHADHLDGVQAMLSGMKKRYQKLGVAPILIHTSGTGVLTSSAKGMFPTDVIYDDLNAEQIESLAITQPHRDVDVAIVDADKQGYLKSYIVLPSTIYGIASNSLVDTGVQHPYSQQIPKLITVSLARGQGGMVGKGLALWPNVDIEEVADLYIVLLDAVRSHPDATGHGREGYYFGENGEHQWYDISKEISKVLVELGRGETDEPTTLSSEELIKYFGSEAAGHRYGTNSRCRANRSRALGWLPKKTTADMIASIKADAQAIAQNV